MLETRRENENLQTIIETLKQENKNLQIEKDTEVEALNSQVIIILVREAATKKSYFTGLPIRLGRSLR